MTTPTAVLAALFLAVAAGLGVRALDHARTPEMAMEVPLHRKPRVEIDGLSLEARSDYGVIRIRAGHARAGHEPLGPFRLGPPTFVAVYDIEADIEERSGSVVHVRSKRGRLKDRVLTLDDETRLVHADGSEVPCREVRINLRTARASVR